MALVINSIARDKEGRWVMDESGRVVGERPAGLLGGYIHPTHLSINMSYTVRKTNGA